MIFQKRTLSKVFLVFGFLALFNLAVTGKAEAASLAVDSDCTLNEAITAVNSSADGAGCVKTGAAYGTTDTINLPASTITLDANVTQITSSSDLTIIGVSESSTLIDANGFNGFSSNDNTAADRTFKQFKIKDATLRGIDIGRSQDVIIEHVEVENCSGGIKVNQSVHISLTYVYAHANVDATAQSRAGAELYLNAVNDTDEPTITVSDSKFHNNNGVATGGLFVEAGNHTAASLGLTIERTSSIGNISKTAAGAQIQFQDNSALLDLRIDAVTVSDNVTTPTVAGTGSIFDPTYIAGFQFGVSNLKPQLNLTNVTVANNSITNTVDNHVSIAGFFGLLIDPPEKITLINSTVVGNSVTQTTPSDLGAMAAFFLIAPILEGGSTPLSVTSGGSAQNSLIAANAFNGNNSSCRDDLDGTNFGLDLIYDVTPTNLGNNLSDDQDCTDYTFIANLYDTIDHEVADNGGPVPTIKLLPGSPAINAGGQVLGISTDARGVPRQGYYSVGAYQGVLLAATTDNASSGGGTKLAETGMIAISSIVLAAILLISLALILADYQRHKRPLKAVDPNVHYTLGHHVKLVTIPLLRYRIKVSLQPKSSQVNHF